MPFNSSGVFIYTTTTVTPAVGNTQISSTDFNAFTADVSTGLTTCIAKDGQTTITANLPMATYRHTGVGSANALTDYSSADDVIDNTLLYAGASAVGTDAYTATLSISPQAYKVGQVYSFYTDVANTGACTIDFNSIGATSIKLANGNDPESGDIQATAFVSVQYDGTNFELLNPANAGLSASQFLRSDADDTTTGDITIDKTAPAISLDSDAANNCNILWKEAGANRGVIYSNGSTNAFYMQKYQSNGIDSACYLGMSDAGDIALSGNVDIIDGTFSIDSTEVTSTAAELNILDGVTADATELNLLENATSTDITSSDLIVGVINAVYPVGSVYTSTVATNPATLLGVGVAQTWVATGVGRVLVGVGTSDAAYALDDEGGTSTESAHLHSVSITSGAPSAGNSYADLSPNLAAPNATNNHTHSVSGNTANNSPSTGDNMPPYLVVHMWERTA